MCQWLGVSFATSLNLKEHFVQFVGSNLSGKKAWVSIIWLVVISQIWRNRNNVIFHERSFSPLLILEQVKLQSWEWLRAKQRHFTHSVSE